jgi:hypothetical protein
MRKLSATWSPFLADMRKAAILFSMANFRCRLSGTVHNDGRSAVMHTNNKKDMNENE